MSRSEQNSRMRLGYYLVKNRRFVGVFSGLIVLAVVFWIKNMVGQQTLAPFLLMSLPVLVAAWLGGFQAGLAITLLSLPIILRHFAESEVVGFTRGQTLNLIVFLIQGGVLSFLMGKLHDAWRQVRYQRQHYNQFLDSILDYAIISLDRNGIITYWSEGARRMFGYTSVEMLGTDLKRLFIPEDVALERPRLEMETALKDGSARAENWHVRKDGSRLFVTEQMTAHQGQAEYERGFTKVIQDITERKEIEKKIMRSQEELEKLVAARTQELKDKARELERANVELIRSNRELETFLHVASHDLQEPLRMIATYVQAIGQKIRSEADLETQDYLRFAEESSLQIRALIQDLILYGELRKREVVKTCKNLADVIEEARFSLNQEIEFRRARVDCDAMPDLEIDPRQMRIVFQNLMSNALKFNRSENPLIRITAREGNGEWTISVRDNGIGIDPKFMNKIFTVFQRLHARGEYPGTGMGLAICRLIIEKHEGRIWAESRPEEGSVFSFSIPCVTAEARAGGDVASAKDLERETPMDIVPLKDGG
jgi:PAS domain S-box-containing protein